MIWIAIIIGIISFIGLCYSLSETDGVAIVTVFSLLGLFFSIVVIYQCLSKEPVTYEYSTDEYTLEYKVTTIGEKSDTTYVLTKIKEE